jgi:hypothetical protein
VVVGSVRQARERSQSHMNVMLCRRIITPHRILRATICQQSAVLRASGCVDVHTGIASDALCQLQGVLQATCFIMVCLHWCHALLHGLLELTLPPGRPAVQL